MNSRDQPEETLIGFFEGGLAGQGLSLFDVNKAVSLGISLLDQVTLHRKILSHAALKKI